MLIGDNGIINQTIEATKQTDIAGTREQIVLDLAGKYDTTGNYTNNDVIEAVFAVTGEEVEEGTEIVTTAKGNEVDISDLWIIEEVEYISSEQSYIGYYADLDADGTVEGIIYADLALGGNGEIKTTEGEYFTYSYPAQTGLKEYYISQDSYEGWLGTEPVLSPVKGTTGHDRFYIMSLETFKTSENYMFYWYYNAGGSITDYATTTSRDFGSGKQNTINMIAKWNGSSYGEQKEKDLWGVIQDGQFDIVEVGDDSKKWFIPSAGELVAYYELAYYDDYVPLWSSSLADEGNAFNMDFSHRLLKEWSVNSTMRVKLSSTF